MAAKVMTIHARALEAAEGVDDLVDDLGDALVDGDGPLARAARALVDAMHREEGLGARLEALVDALDDGDVVDGFCEGTWPIHLELRVDLERAFATRGRAWRIGRGLLEVLAMVAQLEGSRFTVRLGRGAVDVAKARREIAARATRMDVLLTDDEAAFDDEDGEDDFEDDDEPEGALHPDEAWLLGRIGLSWPCGIEALAACRKHLGDLHVDRRGHGYDHEQYLRANNGAALLRKRFGRGEPARA